MIHRSSAVCAVAALALFHLACSGSSAGDSCGKVSPCGGDLVGTWKIVTGCVTGSPSTTMSNQACPGETVGNASVDTSGTATFTADGKYSVTETISSSVSFTVPSSCLTSGGATLSCSDLNATGSGDDGGAPGPTTSCATSGSSCACTLSQPAQTVTEMGTYVTAGSTFTATPSSSSTGSLMAGNDGYCVQGNTLHFIAGGADAGATVDLVATRQ